MQKPTSRLQVSGYRFLIRRMEHALVRGDVRMLDDPLRAQSLSLIAGCILAAIILAGFAILAFLRPSGALGSAPIVVARDSGALYVRVGDTIHPVLNLASARLIAGTAAMPEMVDEVEIAASKRGPLLGIPGAPPSIADPLPAEDIAWTVCDTRSVEGTDTSVIVGDPGDGLERLDPAHAVLVTPHGGSAARTYLLYGGRRAEVDLRDASVVRALRLDGVAPRPVSRVVLDTVPEAPPITPPLISDVGVPGPRVLSGLTVGDVVRVARVDTVEYYIVLAEGVQRIGQVAAELIRFTVAQTHREVRTVPADLIAAVPAVEVLPVGSFPSAVRPADHPVVCAQWTADPAAGSADVAVLVGDSPLQRPENRSMALVQSDGAGPHVDTVVMPPGRSAYVRATGITGGGGGSVFLVNDAGVVFGIADDNAAAALGLSTAAPAPAPWPLLAVLPRGPELSKAAASVMRDGVGPS